MVVRHVSTELSANCVYIKNNNSINGNLITGAQWRSEAVEGK